MSIPSSSEPRQPSAAAELPFSPSADRNKGPILEVLRSALPAHGEVLEIAAGTGQHAAWFAHSLPSLRWRPTEADARLLPVIAARCSGLANVEQPILLEVTSTPWAVECSDAIVCINMIHIAPWTACEALFEQAGRILVPGGIVFLYGPFLRAGVVTAPSNVAFDADLRARDPSWGLRSLADVDACAARNGLQRTRVVEMPANNLCVVFTRTAPPPRP